MGRFEPHAVIRDAHRLAAREPPTDAGSHQSDEDRGHRRERAISDCDREIRVGRLTRHGRDRRRRRERGVPAVEDRAAEGGGGTHHRDADKPRERSLERRVFGTPRTRHARRDPPAEDEREER